MPFGAAENRMENRAMTSRVQGRGHAYNTDGQTARPMSELGPMVYLQILINEKRISPPWGGTPGRNKTDVDQRDDALGPFG